MKSYLRFLSKNRLYTAIEVVGLSISLAFVIVLSSYIVNDISINKSLKNTDDIYLCHTSNNASTLDEAAMLYETMPEIISTCKMVQSGRRKSLFDEMTRATYGENQTEVLIMGVSDNFFDFFSFPLAEGDSKTALNSMNSVVISQELANILFPDGNAIGKEFNVFENNPMKMYDPDLEDLDVNLTVTGILKPFPKTVFIEPDMIMNIDLILKKQEEMFEGSSHRSEFDFVRLADGADVEALSADLSNEIKKIAAKRYHSSISMDVLLTPFDEIKKQNPERFIHAFDNIRQGRLFGIYMLMCIFITIVSLLDYIVLTVAFSRFRIKEIATRQILGTERIGIIRRCFAEAFTLLAISCIFASLIAVAFKTPIGHVLGTEIDPLSHVNEYLILAGIIVVMVSIASAVPSYILSSYNALNVIKGEVRHRYKSSFGKIFIASAGFLSIGALAICFGVIRQTRHLINQPFGYDFDNVICIGFQSDDNRFFDELKSMTFVEKAGIYGSLPTEWIMSGIRNNATGNYEDFGFIDGNSGYFDILGIEFIEEHGIMSADSANEKWYICQSSHEGISEYMSEGMLNCFDPVPLSGIVNDIKIGKVKEPPFSRLLFINIIDTPEIIEYYFPIVKVNIDEDEAKALIDEFYRSKGYDDDIFNIFTLRERVEQEIKEESNMMKLLIGFSIVCLLMTVLTIIGLSSYHAQTEEKDNAVRKVFGFSKKEMIRKAILDFTLPVTISAIAAIPVAYMVISRWLEHYEIRTDNSPVIYAGAFAIVIAVTLSATALQALSAARTNPAEALKKE